MPLRGEVVGAGGGGLAAAIAVRKATRRALLLVRPREKDVPPRAYSTSTSKSLTAGFDKFFIDFSFQTSLI